VLLVLGNIAPLTSTIFVFVQALVAGIVGLVVSVGILALLEQEEFKNLVSSLHRIKSFRALKPFGQTVVENGE
jgi:hypothetical protein